MPPSRAPHYSRRYDCFHWPFVFSPSIRRHTARLHEGGIGSSRRPLRGLRRKNDGGAKIRVGLLPLEPETGLRRKLAALGCLPEALEGSWLPLGACRKQLGAAGCLGGACWKRFGAASCPEVLVGSSSGQLAAVAVLVGSDWRQLAASSDLAGTHEGSLGHWVSDGRQGVTYVPGLNCYLCARSVPAARANRAWRHGNDLSAARLGSAPSCLFV